MKKLIILFATGIIMSVQSLDAQCNWQPVGLPGISAGWTGFTSIAKNTSNTPYVVYQDGGNAGKATVMKYDGSAWATVGLAGFSTSTVQYTSIAIDGSGIPYVVYQDLGNSAKATVMKYDGSAWITVGTAGLSAGMAAFTSIAIDGNGVPYIVYQDGGNAAKVTVMKFNGTSWVPVGSAGISAGIADYTSIGFDAAGNPHVVYQDYSNGNKATVIKFNGTTWVPVGAPGISAGKANWTSIVFTGIGTPYIAYQDDANGGKATVLRFNGTSWDIVGTAGFSAGNSQSPDIAIDGSGTPFVVCGNNAISDKITVMRFNGVSWVNFGPAGFAGGSSAGNNQYTSIVIDGSGIPIVAFSRDFANNEKATVMTFKQPPTVTVNSATVCPGSTVKFFPSGAMTYSISGGNFTVNPLVTTVYTVTGTALNGCASIATATVTAKVCTGMNEFSENEKLILYPNPANDLVTINASETIRKIEIFDINGRQIGSYFPQAASFELKDLALTSGVYLFKITTVSGTNFRKVMIEPR